MSFKFPPKISGGVVAMLLVSLLLMAVFSIYMLLLGIPMTQARNELNAGIILFERGRFEEARVRIEKSQSLWKSNLAEEYLAKIDRGN